MNSGVRSPGALEQVRFGDVGQALIAFEEAMRGGAAGMDDPLRDPLMVEMEDLLAKDEILAAAPARAGRISAGSGCPKRGCPGWWSARLRPRPTPTLMRFATIARLDAALRRHGPLPSAVRGLNLGAAGKVRHILRTCFWISAILSRRRSSINVRPARRFNRGAVEPIIPSSSVHAAAQEPPRMSLSRADMPDHAEKATASPDRFSKMRKKNANIVVDRESS